MCSSFHPFVLSTIHTSFGLKVKRSERIGGPMEEAEMKGGTCDHDNNDPKISRNKQLIDAERPPNDD